MNFYTFLCYHVHCYKMPFIFSFLYSCMFMCVYVCVFTQPLELICEKAIATCNRPLGAGEALRRVMECLASGILLPGMEPWWMHERTAGKIWESTEERVCFHTNSLHGWWMELGNMQNVGRWAATRRHIFELFLWEVNIFNDPAEHSCLRKAIITRAS